jgi:hypothetical protein
MSHQSMARPSIPGGLSIVGGALVLVGTYWISWFSLTGWSGYHFGGFSLYQLRTFVNAGWNTHASQVMTLGAAILVISGIAGLIAAGGRTWLNWACAVGTAIGSSVTLFAAISTGLPHWSTHEPLFYSRDAGEWICVAGALLGIAGCVMTTMVGSRLREPRAKADIQLPTVSVTRG